MDCETAQRLIHAFIDEELDDDQRSALEDHLARCPACKEATGQFRAMLTGFDWLADTSKSLPRFDDLLTEPAPPVITDVRETRPATKAVVPFPYAKASIALAAAAAIVLMIVLPLRRVHDAEQPRVAQRTSQPAVQPAVPQTQVSSDRSSTDTLAHATQSAGAEFEIRLTGASDERYILVQEPQTHPRVHIVWLHKTVNSVNSESHEQSEGQHLQIARS